MKELPMGLTSEQEQKLLEMARHFFTEYDYIDWYETKHDGYRLHHPEVAFVKNNRAFKIHWFEFIQTYLAEEIIAKPVTRTTQDKLAQFFLNTNEYWYCMRKNAPVNTVHPVDYLYKKFKQIKK